MTASLIKKAHTYLQNETIYILTYQFTKYTRKNLVFIWPIRAHHTLVLAPAATLLQYACFTSLRTSQPDPAVQIVRSGPTLPVLSYTLFKCCPYHLNALNRLWTSGQKHSILKVRWCNHFTERGVLGSKRWWKVVEEWRVAERGPRNLILMQHYTNF